MPDWGVKRGRPDDPGNERRFCNTELVGVLAEVMLRRVPNSKQILAKIGAVCEYREQVSARIAPLQLGCRAKFRDVTLQWPRGSTEYRATDLPRQYGSIRMLPIHECPICCLEHAGIVFTHLGSTKRFPEIVSDRIIGNCDRRGL